MINKRLFGTPIKDPVRSLLQKRQGDVSEDEQEVIEDFIDSDTEELQ